LILIFVLEPTAPETTVKFHLANIVYTETMAHLAADVLAAHRLGLPLGAVRGVAGRMLTESRPVSVADVIFHLSLPVLEGIPAAELMKFREDHTDEFASFRRGLTRAAQERIKVTPTKAVATIAREIQSDFIEPELSKIRVALAATEKSLKKKATVGMFLVRGPVHDLRSPCGCHCTTSDHRGCDNCYHADGFGRAEDVG